MGNSIRKNKPTKYPLLIKKVLIITMSLCLVLLQSPPLKVNASDSGVPFAGFNSQNMDLQPENWSTNGAAVGTSKITLYEASGSAVFYINLESIAEAVDYGHLQIDFSVLATIAGTADLANATIDFRASEYGENLDSITLDRGTSAVGTGVALTSQAAIPADTRFIFITLAGEQHSSLSAVGFAQPSLIIRDTQNPTLSAARNTDWTSDDIVVTITADDTQSGIEGIYQEDGTKLTAANTYQYTATANESQRFYTQDYSGRTSDILVVDIANIDRSAPAEAPGILLSQVDWSAEPVDFSLMDNLPAADESPERKQYQLNNGSWIDYTDLVTISAQGATVINSRYIDAAGNVSATATATAYVDTEAPVITELSFALEGSGAVVTLIANDGVGSGISESRYASGSRNASYFAAGGTVIEGTSFTVSTGGLYTVYLVDNVGNVKLDTVSINTYPLISGISSQSLDEGVSKEISFTIADAETAAGDLIITAVSSDHELLDDPTWVNDNGTVDLTLTPVAYAHGGPVTVTITVTDEGGHTTEKTFTVNINSVNDAPSAMNDDIVVTNEDTSVTLYPLSNDVDIDGDVLHIAAVGNAAHGTVTISEDQLSVVYTPNANYNGPDSFTYTASDLSLNSNTATITISVSEVNDHPAAVNDNVLINEDTPVTIDVLDNDQDADLSTATDEVLTILSFSDPEHGSVELSDGKLLYTPDLNWSGRDSFTYTLQDRAGVTSTASVIVTVKAQNDAPALEGLDSEITVNEDCGEMELVFTIDDVETATSSLMLQVSSSNQSLVPFTALSVSGLGTAEGTITLKYRPTANNFGDTRLTFRLSDGFTVTQKSVIIHVLSQNDDPVLTADEYAFAEDTDLTLDFNDLLANDSDVDGDPLTLAGIGTAPAHGTLTLVADQIYQYVPDADYSGDDSFTYLVSDQTVTVSGVVTLKGNAVNDAPLITADPNNDYTFNEDETSQPLRFTISDIETAADELIVTAGSHNVDLISDSQIQITEESAGHYALLITPNQDQFGTAEITVTVSDKKLLASITLNLTVAAVTDAPQANDDYIQLSQNSNTSFSVLLNDYDVEGHSFELLSYTNPSHGSLSLTDGIFNYQAEIGYAGSDYFTYIIGHDGLTSEGTVYLSIGGYFFPPVISGIANRGIWENQQTSPLPFSVFDYDVDDTLTVTAVSSNTALIPNDDEHLSLTMDAETGQRYLTVKPLAYMSGSAVITLTVTDQTGRSASTVFSVYVYPIDFPVAAAADYITLDEDATQVLDLLSNDLDPDTAAEDLQIIAISSPSHGWITWTESGYAYTPYTNYHGSDTFQYTVTDGTTNVSADVYLTVKSVNDAPHAETVYQKVANVSGSETRTVAPLNSAYDVDGDELYIDSVVSSPAYGTVVINADNTLTYTRTALSPLDNGRDSFTILIRDRSDLSGDVKTCEQTIVIGVDFAPSLDSDDVSVEVNEDSDAFWINLDYNNPFDHELSVTVTDSSLGTILETDLANHRVLFEPAANANGTETLTYTVTDSTADPVSSSSSKIYLRINSVNDAPVFTHVITDQTLAEDQVSDWLTVTFADADATTPLIFTYYVDNGDGYPLILSADILTQRLGNIVLLKFPPLGNAYGDATIIMQVSDGLAVATTSFKLTVTSVNDAPSASDYQVSLPEDGFMNFTVLSPNSDADGDALTVSILTAPEHGTATVNADQTITYIPEANYHGEDVLTYQFDDGNGGQVSAQVYLTVDSINDLPQIMNLKQKYSALEDHSLTADFSAADLDLDPLSAELSYTSSALFPEGAITITQTDTGWTLTAVPQENQSGTQTVTMTVSDKTGEVSQEIELTILPENDLPTAAADEYDIDEDTEYAMNVLNNDSDVEDSALKIVEVSAAASGAKLVVNSNGTITYQPVENYYGDDYFTYTISDSADGRISAEVNLHILSVNDQPAAETDEYAIDEDETLIMPVLANDSDIESDVLTITEAGNGSSLAASITINADGTLTYVPLANVYGTDEFTYTISDGQPANATATGTVKVVISPVNDAPIITADERNPGLWSFNEDETGTFYFNVSDQETDVKNLILTITSDDQNLIPDTSITYSGVTTAKTAVLIPALNASGTCHLTITVTDGEEVTEKTFEIEVTAVNDAPVITAEDQTTNEDTAVTAMVSGTDIESTGLTFTVGSDPEVLPQHGQVVMQANGTYTYTPQADFNGTDQFTVYLNDGSTSATAISSQVITITVLPINDAPVAHDDTAATDEDTPLTLDVLANDSDIDRDSLLNVDPDAESLTIVSDGFSTVANGTVTIADNKIVYTPQADFNGTETFSYQITDQSGSTATATVTITVQPVDDQPSSGDDAVSLAEDTAVTIDVLTNDDIDTATNPDLEALSITGVATSPQYGTAEISSDSQQIIYTPTADYFGTDSLVYTMQDQNGHTASFTVNLTISSVNDKPAVSVISNVTTNEDTASEILNFKVTDVEDAWGSLKVTAVSSNTTLIPNNRITIANLGNDDRSIYVTPAANRSGTANITVTVTDANGATSTRVFTVTVTAVNDAPTAQNDSYTTNENTQIIIDPLYNDDVDRGLEGDTLMIVSITDSDATALGAYEVFYDSAAKRDRIRYTPDADWTSTTAQNEVLNYTMMDASGLVTSGAAITITVTPVNDAPQISTLADQTIAEDTPGGTGALAFTVTDEEDDDSLLTVTTDSSNTELVPLDQITIASPSGGNPEDRTVTATTALDQNGSSVITLTVTDANGLQTTTSFTVTVTPVDDAPVDGDDTYDVTEDTPTTLNVLENDDIDTITNSDLEHLNVTAIASAPAHGTAAIAADHKTILYTPAQDNNAADSFTYTMESENGQTATFTVLIKMIPVNDAPVIHSTITDQTGPEATAFSPLSFTVSDVDDDWSGLTVTVSSTNRVLIPLSNIVVANLGNGDRSVTITPAGRWNGTSTITLTVKDDEGKYDTFSTASFKVTVTAVNDAPVANNDLNIIMNEDTTAALNVLSNDTDPDLTTNPATETMTIISVADVDNGTVSIINSGKKLSFTPTADWNGTEEFTYTIQDAAGLQSTATVKVKVNGRNDAPAVGSDEAATDEDTAVTINALANDSDVDTDITLNNDPYSAPADEYLAILPDGFSGLDHGTAAVSDNKIIFSPEADWNGTEVFSYTVIDASGAKTTGEITVVVKPINDPPVAVNDETDTDEDQPITVNVLNNDSDVDLSSAKNAVVTDVLSVSIKTGPSVGTASIENNQVVYTPVADYNGTQTIVYTVTDASDVAVDATLVIVINQINDTPVAQNDSASTDEDNAVTIDVLANDSDIDLNTELNADPGAEQLTIMTDGFSGVEHGTVSIVDNQVVFTPEANFNGTEVFTYTVVDAQGASCEADVEVTVNSLNDDPTAQNDTAETNEDTAVTIDVLANDDDVDTHIDLNAYPQGDYLLIKADGFSGVEHGTVSIVDNQVVFTPETDYNGSESFMYTVTDQSGKTVSAEVTVTISQVNDHPIALSDTASSEEDNAVTIDVLANDHDVDTDVDYNADPSADYLTIKADGFSGVEHGTVSIVDNRVVFTPEANFNGTESFYYTVADAHGAFDTAEVTIVITAQADDPVAVYDNGAMAEDGSALFDVLTNDYDHDANAELNQDPDFDYQTETLTIVPDGFLNVTHGTASVENNQIRFIPETDYNGTVSFSYTISDATGRTANATLTIVIGPVNDTPVAVNDSVNVNEDNAVVIAVIGNDSDVDLSTLLNHPVSDALTVSVNSAPSHGTAAVSGQSIRYTPTANYNGSDSFTYKLKDKAGAYSTATVTVTVKAINDRPVTVSDSASTNEDTAVTIDALANDTDVDTIPALNLDPTYNPAAETKTLVPDGFSGVEHGTVSIIDNKIVFTPTANYNGVESFTYKVKDLAGLTATGTVTLTVGQINDDPAAQNDTAGTAEDTAVTIDVLANDDDVDTHSDLNADPSADYLTIKADGFSGVEHGTVNIVDNQVVFTPETDYNGSESFTYTITDQSGKTASAEVTVTISTHNDAPIAEADAASTDEDGVVTIDVLANDHDVDTDGTLNADPSADYLTIKADGFSGVEHGTVNIVDNQVVFTPEANFNGTETFTYTVLDAHNASATAEVTITVNPLNDDPAAQNDTAGTAEDTAVTIDVLANDDDVDTYSNLNADPSADYLTIKADGFSGVEHGTFNIVDNQVVFTPETDYNGSESFTYTITDQSGKTVSAEVTVTISQVNDLPTAVNDTAETNEDTAVTIDVLANDDDVDTHSDLNADPSADYLTIKADGFSGVEHGTVNIVDNQVVFTPEANFNGTETFTYTVLDAHNASATAEVTITVNPLNDDPTAQNDTANTAEDTAVTIDVLANDDDVDTHSDLNADPSADYLTIKADGFSGVEHGTVSIVDHQVVFTPETDYNGSESFTYTITDQSGKTVSAEVIVTISQVNDLPTAVNDTAETNEDTAVTIDVLANDDDVDTHSDLNADPSADYLTIKADGFSGVEHGTVSIVDNQVVFTPEADYNGTETFTYTVMDVNNAAVTAEVTVTIIALNNNPTAANDEAVTNEDTAVTIDVLANDSDIDLDPLLNLHPELESLTILADGFSGVEHGTVSIVDNQVVFTPEADFNGTETFTYTISDHYAATTSAEVSLTITAVNDAPVGQDDAVTINENETITLDVLANDQDVDFDSLLNVLPDTGGLMLSEHDYSTIEHGSVTIADQQLTFVPEPNYNGLITFDYYLEDEHGVTHQAAVTITILNVNNDPIANNDSVSGDEDTAIIIDVLANDEDLDLDPALNVHPENEHLTILEDGFSGVEHGTVSIVDNQVVFTPEANYNGPVDFTYTIKDTGDVTVSAAVSLLIKAVNDKPTASDMTAVTNEDTAVLIDVLPGAGDVDQDAGLNLDPDYDPSSEVLSVLGYGFTDQPSSSFVNSGSVIHVNNASVQVLDGKLKVTPDADYSGTLVFYYTIQDTAAAYQQAKITVQVIAVNDAPAAQNDQYYIAEDETVSLDVLANDTDLDFNHEGDSLRVTSIGEIRYGTAVISADGRQIIFTPEANYNGVLTFTYTMSDQGGASSTATVTMIVRAVADPLSELQVLTPIAQEKYKNGQTIHVTWTPAVDLDGETVIYKLYYFDGTSWQLLADKLTETFYDHQLSGGDQETNQAQYRVEAWDSSSHIEAAGAQFVIDNAAPRAVQVTIMCGAETITSGTKCGQAVKLQVSGGQDLLAFTYTYSLDNGATWQVLPDNHDFGIDFPGKYTVIIRTTDELGNSYDTAITIEISDNLTPLSIMQDYPYAIIGLLLLLVILFLLRPVTVEYVGYDEKKKRAYHKTTRRFALAPLQEQTLRLDVTRHPRHVVLTSINIRFCTLFTRWMRQRHVMVIYDKQTLGQSYLKKDQQDRWYEEFPLNH